MGKKTKKGSSGKRTKPGKTTTWGLKNCTPTPSPSGMNTVTTPTQALMQQDTETIQMETPADGWAYELREAEHAYKKKRMSPMQSDWHRLIVSCASGKNYQPCPSMSTMLLRKQKIRFVPESMNASKKQSSTSVSNQVWISEASISKSFAFVI